jgi:membrane protease YdiL (CAAX protease family)
MMAHPHPEPRTYPMMLRTWDYRWWKPVVGILLLAVGMLLVMPLLLLPVLAVAVALEGGPGTYGDQFAAALNLDSVTPASMLYLNLTLASLTLVCMGIVRVVHRLRPRWLSSVLPGMRWKFFFICFGLAIVALIASVAVSNFIPSNPNDLGGEPNKLTGTLVATGIVILLTTPLQAIGEEYAFRGYLMQAFGSLTHGIMEAIGVSRVWAVRIALSVALLVTSGLFGLAHGAQNFPLFFDRFAFGLMAGLVVILVGGLEAGIALHILNNLLAFAVAIFFGDLQGALTVSEVSWWQLPVTIVQNGVFLVLVLLVARRMGLSSRTTPPVPQTTDQTTDQSTDQAAGRPPAVHPSRGVNQPPG